MSVAVTVQSVPITVTVQDQAPIVVSISAVGTPGATGPAGVGVPVGGTAGQSLIKASATDYDTTWGSPTAIATWGTIIGVLTNQTDLQTALNAKLPVANPAYTGTFTEGSLAYSPANALAAMQQNVNSYTQVIIQNTNTGAVASADFIVNNDQSTDTAKYGDFGINSSGFVGTGPLSTPGNVYLTATGEDLALGTTSANAIHLVANGGATDALTVDSANVARVPTPTVGDSSTKIASTAFVQSAASLANNLAIAYAIALGPV
jgi:hypothetical protein